MILFKIYKGIGKSKTYLSDSPHHPFIFFMWKFARRKATPILYISFYQCSIIWGNHRLIFLSMIFLAVFILIAIVDGEAAINVANFALTTIDHHHSFVVLLRNELTKEIWLVSIFKLTLFLLFVLIFTFS